MSLIPSPPIPPPPPPTLPFGGATYPFPPLPESALIFSTRTFCRSTYTTCMDVFRDCLRVVGPIGNGSNMLCETYRNDVCENGIRVGCDGLPPDRQEGVMEEVPEGIEFEMPVTMTDGPGGGGGGPITTPGFTVPAMPMMTVTGPPPSNFPTPPPLPTGTFVTTVTTSVPFVNEMGETTRWESMTATMTMTRDRRGLVFMVSGGGRSKGVTGATRWIGIGLGILVAVGGGVLLGGGV